jgi:hypothetical protein
LSRKLDTLFEARGLATVEVSSGGDGVPSGVATSKHLWSKAKIDWSVKLPKVKLDILTLLSALIFANEKI